MTDGFRTIEPGVLAYLADARHGLLRDGFELTDISADAWCIREMQAEHGVGATGAELFETIDWHGPDHPFAFAGVPIRRTSGPETRTVLYSVRGENTVCEARQHFLAPALRKVTVNTRFPISDD